MNVKSTVIVLAALIMVSVEAGLLDAVKNSKLFRHFKHKSNGTKENDPKYNARINTNLNDDDDWITVQSPIALSVRKSKVLKHDFEPIKFHGHWEHDGEAYIEDTGSSAKITFQGRHERPYISGGLFKPNETYIFEQMHLHWGEKDDHGSEHEIDGKVYSMEAHLVHFNAKYGDFDTAANHKDGLVVVAFFIKAKGNKKNHDFAKITDQLQNAQELHSKSFLATDCLKWMASQELDKHYFTYHGSLTTPPYTESVTWIIYRKPIQVSKQQVAAFRKLRSTDNEHKITKNRRELQTPDKRLSVIFTGKP